MGSDKGVNVDFPYFDQRFEDGIHVVSLGLTQVLEFSTPFLCNVDWVQTSLSPGFVGALPTQFDPSLFSDGNGGVTPSVNWLAVSAGPDFGFCFHVPPPCNLYRWYDADLTDLNKRDETSSFSESFEITLDETTKPSARKG